MRLELGKRMDTHELRQSRLQLFIRKITNFLTSGFSIVATPMSAPPTPRRGVAFIGYLIASPSLFAQVMRTCTTGT